MLTHFLMKYKSSHNYYIDLTIFDIKIYKLKSNETFTYVINLTIPQTNPKIDLLDVQSSTHEFRCYFILGYVNNTRHSNIFGCVNTTQSLPLDLNNLTSCPLSFSVFERHYWLVVLLYDLLTLQEIHKHRNNYAEYQF